MIERRALGGTGLRVSALGFGCGSVGGLLVRGEPAEQRAAVAAALDAGVRYFDTAPTYGDGRSEEALGRVLREIGAEPLIGTKFRLAPDATDVGGEIRRSLEGSLRRLGRERVDLLQLHSRVGSGSDTERVPVEIVVGPVADALDEMKREGRIGAAGFTGLGDPDALHRVIDSGRFDSVQAYVNVLNPSAGFAGTAAPGEPDFAGLIGHAATAGTGALGIRTLAAGAVGADARHVNAGPTGGSLIPGTTYAADARRAEQLRTLAVDAGLESTVELALRFALGIAGVSAVLVGFSDERQVHDAVRFVARGALPGGTVERIVSAARSARSRPPHR